MSDLMLLGVLRMPIDPNSGPVALTQFFARAREAADRIESDAAEIERLRAALAQPPAPTAQPAFDMLAHIRRHIEFSQRTFGPGPRAAGVVDHIRKELREIEAAPHDLEEWIDVMMLAMDGAWRSGATPAQIVAQLVAKQTKNEGRKWPDWRTAPAGKAIEHDRSGEDAQPVQQPGAEPQPSGYESTTTCYTRWVSPERWAKFSPGVQKWYRPYWAPAQRQPLSDEQIDSLTFPFLTAELGPTAYDRAIARAIEAAHGITAAPAAQKGEKL